MNTPQNPHCDKCWVTEIATENDGEYMRVNPQFCCNDTCPCHVKVPKDSVWERFDETFAGEVLDKYTDEYDVPARKLIKSFFRKEIERAIEELKHTRQNCDCEGMGCPRNSTLRSLRESLGLGGKI